MANDRRDAGLARPIKLCFAKDIEPYEALRVLVEKRKKITSGA